MLRQDRVTIHKKRESAQIKSGVPQIADLKEGVTVLRSTAEGLVEYTKYNNKLYKKVLERE